MTRIAIFNTKNACLHQLSLLAICLLVFVTTSGCNSYNATMGWVGPLPPLRSPQIGCNPKFIFDMPAASNRDHFISSEQFTRAPWPASPEARRHVSDVEITTYREDILNEQYNFGTGKPHNRFRNRVRTQRVGRIAR